jgi:hypothetical protein
MLPKLMLAMSLTGTANKAGEKLENTARKLFALMGLQGFGDILTDEFSNDSRAQVGGANRATNLVVGLVVAGLMAAFLLPIAIEEITNTSTSNWSDGAASLWSVLPIMIVLAIFLFFVGLALQNR